MKQCSKCKEVKPLIDYHKNGKYLRTECKQCQHALAKERRVASPNKTQEYGRRYRELNKDKIKERNHRRYLENKEKWSANNRRWKSENKEKIKEAGRKYRAENAEEIKERHFNYRVANADKVKEGILKWQVNNPEKVKAKQRRAAMKKRATINGQLNNIMTSGICRSLHEGKAGRHWETLVNYTINQLKKHLEKQFKPGMSWDNYGKYWHIDHIIPKAAFNFISPKNIDFKKCWALKNLRPLKASENISKRDKLDKPFQPALTI